MYLDNLESIRTISRKHESEIRELLIRTSWRKNRVEKINNDKNAWNMYIILDILSSIVPDYLHIWKHLNVFIELGGNKNPAYGKHEYRIWKSTPIRSIHHEAKTKNEKVHDRYRYIILDLSITGLNCVFNDSKAFKCIYRTGSW